MNEVKLDGTIVKKEIGYTSDKTCVVRLRLRNKAGLHETYVDVGLFGEQAYQQVQEQMIVVGSRVLVVGRLVYGQKLKSLYVLGAYIKKLDEPVQEDLPV